MKTTIKLTALAAALACGLIVTQAGVAQPQMPAQNGAVTEQRPVGAFSAIELHGPYRVLIEAQGKPALSVTGERKDIDEVVTEVHGDTLVVHPRNQVGFTFNLNFGKQHEPVTVRITAAALKSLRMSGSGDVDVNHIGGDALGIADSGSGDLRANGAVRQLGVNNSGSGDLDLHDLQAADARLEMHGSGDVRLAGVSSTLSAEVTGSGDLSADGVHASKVEARMHGSGDVHLTGSSRDLRLEISGSGDFGGCDLAVETANTVQHSSGGACIGGKLRGLDAEVMSSGDLSVRGLQGQSARLRMHGSGNVDLAGTVDQLNVDLSGSGDLDAHGLNAGHADIQVHGSGSAAVRVLDQGGQGRLLLVDRSGSRTRQ